MKYISKIKECAVRGICVGPGYAKEVHSGADFFDYIDNYTVVVENDAELGQRDCHSDIVGVGYDGLVKMYLACEHTSRTALFMQYVESVTMWQNTHTNVDLFGDVIYFPEGIVAYRQGEDKPCENLDVRMTSQSVSLCDSVVIYDEAVYNDSASVVCTLYDFFVFVCRMSHVNIMKYKTIQFSSQVQGWVSTVKLTQTPESQRFFMKMWMDVVGDYRAGRLPEVAYKV